MSQNCLICQKPVSTAIRNQFVPERKYFHCQNCDLIFLAPEQRVTVEKEQARYATHENQAQNSGYREFMMKFAGPVLSYLQKNQIKIESGLDYGAGQSSPLAPIFSENMIKIYEYDPYFKNFPHLLEKKYDLVMATEVVEHFREPLRDFEKMKSLLNSKGTLALMTQFHQGAEHFSSWWYPKDFTHICFYSERTFSYLSESFRLKIELLKNPVVLFSLA